MTRPQPKSMLSIDFGKKRIGLAGCDPLGISITVLPAIHRKNITEDINIIKLHCLQRQVKGIVIGLPLDNKGKETKQSKYCKAFGMEISESLNLPIVWVNEHSTTLEASQKFQIKNDRSGKIDSAAAALILEQWLNEGPDLGPTEK